MSADKLKEEAEELRGQVKLFESRLADRKMLLELVKEDARAFADKHGTPRRTEILVRRPGARKGGGSSDPASKATLAQPCFDLKRG